VRPIDGMYSIRRRASYSSRPTAVVEWTASDAVTKADTGGRATNELSIQVRRRKKRSSLVNAKRSVHGRTLQSGRDGVVGYRINHNLDVLTWAVYTSLGVHHELRFSALHLNAELVRGPGRPCRPWLRRSLAVHSTTAVGRLE